MEENFVFHFITPTCIQTHRVFRSLKIPIVYILAATLFLWTRVFFIPPWHKKRNLRMAHVQHINL